MQPHNASVAGGAGAAPLAKDAGLKGAGGSVAGGGTRSDTLSGTGSETDQLRSLHHRRGLGRSLGRRRRRRVRPERGADREAQDGRRLPQLRLRAVEGADRRRQAGPRHAHVRARSALRRSSRSSITKAVHDHVHQRHRGHRAKRFRRALHRARRARHHRSRPFRRSQHGRRRRAPHHRAPLRHRHRLVAGRAADPRSRQRALFHQRDHLRQRRQDRSSRSLSAAARSAWSWRRRIAVSARASRWSKD